jgi:hypothetical protein
MPGVSPGHSDSITRSRLLGIAIYFSFLSKIHLLHSVKAGAVAWAALVVVPPLLIQVAIISGSAYKIEHLPYLSIAVCCLILKLLFIEYFARTSTW